MKQQHTQQAAAERGGPEREEVRIAIASAAKRLLVGEEVLVDFDMLPFVQPASFGSHDRPEDCNSFQQVARKKESSTSRRQQLGRAWYGRKSEKGACSNSPPPPCNREACQSSHSWKWKYETRLQELNDGPSVCYLPS